MSMLNKPKISAALVSFYVGIVVFLGAVFSVVSYLVYTQVTERSIIGIVVLVIAIGFSEGIMLWLLASIYRTTYIVTGQVLVLKAPALIGGNKKIPLEAIVSMQRTLIPFGFRLFGASFYGGYYYFPSVGRAFMVITNFRDGVLIKATNGSYVITPRSPDDFIQYVERNRAGAATGT
jgi:hypothetical protein